MIVHSFFHDMALLRQYFFAYYFLNNSHDKEMCMYTWKYNTNFIYPFIWSCLSLNSTSASNDDDHGDKITSWILQI